jgi:hypothetical protein
MMELNRSQWSVLTLCDGKNTLEDIESLIIKKSAEKIRRKRLRKKLKAFLDALETRCIVELNRQRPRKNIRELRPEGAFV